MTTYTYKKLLSWSRDKLLPCQQDALRRVLPLCSVNSTAWLNARARTVAKYQERVGEPAPEGFRTLHVHDLRHTVGRRLRAAVSRSRRGRQSLATRAAASRLTTPRRSYANCWMRWNSSPPTTSANRTR
jgi:hypothetical protein